MQTKPKLLCHRRSFLEWVKEREADIRSICADVEELSSSTLLVAMMYADTPVVFPKDKHLFCRNSQPRIPLQVHTQEQCAPVRSPKTCTNNVHIRTIPQSPTLKLSQRLPPQTRPAQGGASCSGILYDNGSL